MTFQSADRGSHVWLFRLNETQEVQPLGGKETMSVKPLGLASYVLFNVRQDRDAPPLRK